MIGPYREGDARCVHCNTNVEAWQHLACAPCPASDEHEPVCASCCASSDRACTDCLSVLDRQPPEGQSSIQPTIPHGTPFGLLTGTDAAAAVSPTHPRAGDAHPAAAAPHTQRRAR